MIRTYQESDLAAILEIWYQASLVAHPFLSDDFLAQEKRNIRDVYMPNTETWVLAIDDQIVGVIAMMDDEVGAIFVHPDFHGKGLGTQLMDHVAALHPTLEVEVFKANAIGRAFYEKYGFQLIQEHLHDATGQPLLRLRFTA